GADAARRREGVFAAAPKAHPLFFAVAHADGRGSGSAQHIAHTADFFFHFFGGAVGLAQQNGFGGEVVAGFDKVFHGGGHGLVHHLQPGGDDAGGNHGGHGIAGFAHVVKAGHDAARQLGLGDEFHGHFGHHGQHAFAADHGGQ